METSKPLGRRTSIVPVERGELAAVTLAFVQLFLVLCGYYLIRPIREALGAEIGAGKTHWLFTATFLSMLLVNPIFNALASRWSRQFLIPVTYTSFVVMMFVFAFLLRTSERPLLLSATFYVWVSVFNYIAVSVFWSVLADLFTIDQGKRLFGAVSAGGTLGALCGPLLVDRWIGRLGFSGMLNLAAIMFCFVTVVAMILTRLQVNAANSSPRNSTSNQPLGGSAWAGMVQTLTSPYLLAIGIYMLLGSLIGSMIYVEQTRIVGQQVPTLDRPQFFARIDLAVNLLALGFELLVAGPLFSIAGLRIPLIALPVIGMVGIPLISMYPSAMLVAGVMVLRRSTEYAIAKPAREVLFTVVSREQKYKSKNFIDTVLARGGDAIGAWVTTLVVAKSGPQTSLLTTSIMVGLVFLGIGWWLVSEQRRRTASLT